MHHLAGWEGDQAISGERHGFKGGQGEFICGSACPVYLLLILYFSLYKLSCLALSNVDI